MALLATAMTGTLEPHGPTFDGDDGPLRRHAEEAMSSDMIRA
jgi:hypothetical protein